MCLKKLLYIILFSSVLFSCNQEDDDSLCSTSGPPEFVQEPVALNDTRSVEFRLQTNMPANIYYVISTTPLEDKAPSSVKARAQAGDTRSGTFQIGCDDIDTLKSFFVSELPSNTTIYAYLIAESSEGDHLLQEETTTFTFATGERLAIEKFFSEVKGREALYVRYLPTKNTSGDEQQLHPLIIFLGGNSEVSPVGQITVVQNGSVLEYVSKGHHLPFIVIGPEHNTNSWNPDFIHDVVTHALETYPVDPERIIITGLSGGANGVLNYAFRYPEIPAAIVPISGWAEDPDRACSTTNMAVWLFHQESDPKVPTEHSIQLYDVLQNCDPPSSKEVMLTLFKDHGHTAWFRVYDPKHTDWKLDKTVEPINIYDWMYEQRR